MMVPTGGRASIAGHDVVKEAAEVRRHVGVVFQTQSLDKALTVMRTCARRAICTAERRPAHRAASSGRSSAWAWRTAAKIWWKRSRAACGVRVEIAKPCCTGRWCC